jgi:hypothetical protein
MNTSACTRTRENLAMARRNIHPVALAKGAAGAGRVLFLLVAWLCHSAMLAWGGSSQGISYKHHAIPEGPWSIHVVQVDRSFPSFKLHSALPNGATFGLTTLTEHIQALPADIGRPVAGINGDFHRRRNPHLGDPQGLQILRGELVSGPSDWSCFWIDPAGQPQMTNVTQRFYAVWPNGQKTSIGLNEIRARNAAVLYTAAAGPATQTSDGRELVLERHGTNRWLPLQAGQKYLARVRQVRNSGNSRVSPDTMVLSLGPLLASRPPSVKPGSVLQISTGTWPDLKGVETALGGGPPLIRDGNVLPIRSSNARHPRAAIGWNKDFYFLIVVDGRQRELSVGMTLSELAEYMAQLGSETALNLDGGGSATCWVFGQVMNSPSLGHERNMANALIVVETGCE